MTASAPHGAPWRNFYGRRFGKTLRDGQRRHVDITLATLAVPGVDWAGNPGRAPVDLAALFGGPRPVWLEIGFGAGEHMAALAAANPGIGYVGAEAFENGVAMAIARLARSAIGTARIHYGDVRDLLDVLPDASIARAFLLYPDPWPKRRHHHRRFVNDEGMLPLARVLAPGARFHLATDIADYAAYARVWMARHPGFAPVSDGTVPWPDWHPTRYEVKALREGRVPRYLTWERR